MAVRGLIKKQKTIQGYPLSRFVEWWLTGPTVLYLPMLMSFRLAMLREKYGR